MDEFFDKIKTRDNFYLDETVEPINTESTLLNNSIFSRNWYLYDVEIYNYFVEDHGDDFHNYINTDYVLVDHCFLFTNYNKVDCLLVDYFSRFLEGMLDENKQEIIIDNSRDMYLQEAKIKHFKNYVEAMKRCARENNLIEREEFSDYTGKYFIINEKNVEKLLEKEWKCFLMYEYFDSQCNVYWIMNMNKDSPFFEYVVVLGPLDIMEFYHFSEIEKNMKTIEKVCQEFGLFKN